MTFRDDHDAAIARADALETEVEQANRERDALADKVKALEGELEKRPAAAPKPKPKPKAKAKKPDAKSRPARPPDSDLTEEQLAARRWNRSGWFSGIFIVLLFGGVVGAVLISQCDTETAFDTWGAADQARTDYRERWHALTSVEPCLRNLAYDAVTARRNTPDKTDPRKAHVWSFADRLAGNCLDGAQRLVKDPNTSASVKAALQVWIAVQHDFVAPAKALDAYYSNNDWKEDNFTGAPALWAPVLAILDRQVRAIALVRADALPGIRNELRAKQKVHEALSGRDHIWWRVELTLQLYAINDRAFDIGGIYAGRELDNDAAVAAIREPVIAFLAATKGAPIEIRRIIRKLDWITETIAAGQPLHGETPLWHLSRADDDLIGRAGHDSDIPAMPPDPGKRPRRSPD